MSTKTIAPSEPGANFNLHSNPIILMPTVPEEPKNELIRRRLREIAEASPPALEVEIALKQLSKEFKVSLKPIKTEYLQIHEEFVAENQPLPEPQSPEEIERQKIEQEGIDNCVQQLQKITDIHPVFQNHLSKTGFICDELLASTILLTHGARLLKHSSAFFFTGASGSGKTDGVVKGARFLPPEMVLSLTSVSEQALYYLGDVKNKYLLFGEVAPRVDEQDDFRQMAMRQLISENKITRLVVEKVDGKANVSVMKETEGPCVVVATTTKEPDKFNDELQNRATWVQSNDSKEVTAQVLDVIANRAINPVAANDPNESIVIKGFQSFHRTLASLPVSVPYAPLIIPTNLHVTVRRLYILILTYIQTNALLHQHARERVFENGQEMVVAVIEDYELAYRIATANAPRVLESVASRARNVFEKIVKPAFEQQKLHGNYILTTGQLVKLMGEPDSTARRWLDDYAKSGLLVHIGKQGKQNSYQLPDDPQVTTQDLGLIHPEKVRRDIAWSQV